MMVEVACRVGANGVEPLAMDPVDTFYKGLLENQYAYEKFFAINDKIAKLKTSLLLQQNSNKRISKSSF